ncbi:VOC family protein [Pontibacillus sp. HMF3514]|uniref:VOC family protein n=1 Tax=Pontibacillus sp. HMF3514 TaxID=2692425 RepID=UPI00132007DE|nr:VOC family protein [Pontibacillus sp. HMF3514]QHE53487.1 glyoxalase [Pontibacillus sp. HMF3514]
MEKQFFCAPTTFVGHVELKVQDLEKSINFYENVIGFKKLKENNQKVVFTADGTTTLLSITQPENVKPKENRTSGLFHFAILLPNRLELAKALKHLHQHHVQIGASDHLVSEALYLNDPDGNGIEIYSDRDSGEWEWNNGEVNMAVDPLNFENLLAEVGDGEWTGLPSDTVMGHIHLHVSDLPKSEEFYGKGLGFQIVNRYGNQALFMSTGNYHHHIGLNTWAGVGVPAPLETSVGMKFFTLVYPSEDVRKQVAQQVENLGYEIIQEGVNIYTTDPSGNKIQLAVSNP